MKSEDKASIYNVIELVKKELLRTGYGDRVIKRYQTVWMRLTEHMKERSIKPFVIRRKNWLFCNTSRGAKASSTIYSVIETAKEHGLNPFEYLKYLFEQLPNLDTKNIENIDALLPWSTTLPYVCKVPQK